MIASRMRCPRRLRWSRPALAWATLAVCGIFSTGCQVEYAGMTLPSGKYMLDDVQYFARGPSFPWANTQVATQRARMSAMGMAAADAGSIDPNATPGSTLMRDSGKSAPVGNMQAPGAPADVLAPPVGNPSAIPAPPALAPPAIPPATPPASPPDAAPPGAAPGAQPGGMGR